ncbi:MAG: hypothetical protein ACTSQ8_24350 [Candidatus Helarchaeota archaeon]
MRLIDNMGNKNAVKKNQKKDDKLMSVHNGFIYPFVNSLLNLLKAINLVEGFKYAGKLLAAKTGSRETQIKYSRIAVDIFIIFKWLFVIFILLASINNIWTVVIVWYLLFTNLYTYFFYHVWSTEILLDDKFDIDRIKRRFTTLIQAILFSLLGFAYLYYVPYSSEFTWSSEQPAFIYSLWFSISNSLTASYKQVKPITDVGNTIAMIQLSMMFVFFTIIMGCTVPQITTSIDKKG